MPVDVYVEGVLAIPGFQPGTVAGPVDLPGGCCTTISVFAAGADPLAVDPIIETTTAVPAGGIATLAAHLDARGAPILTTFYEPTFGPSAGNGRLVVRHTAALAPVDVYVGIGPSGARLTKFASVCATGSPAATSCPTASTVW